MKNTFSPMSLFAALLRRYAPNLADAARSHCPQFVRHYYLRKMNTKSMTNREFERIQAVYGQDRKARATYLLANYLCRTVGDPSLIHILRRLIQDFALKNFVETGTFDGDTSFSMSFLFEQVYTCDVVDHPRRPDFYLRDNIVYETMTSPEFLKKHLAKFRTNSLFYLDSHWQEYWPLKDEMRFIMEHCENPVFVLDDFDAGNGLEFDRYNNCTLDAAFIGDLVPNGYKFFLNSWSNRNKGFIFLFPGSVAYGHPFHDYQGYREDRDGLWSDPLK
ncbi:MAG: hypothetical protein FD177_2845 [Desulfovibrionaceae bacterium]|nr:MAG: hypothetical protein FD177_2845 [Desulfovibrionaceae bacterium]